MPPQITQAVVGELLGPTKFDPELRDSDETVGVARGLAWTVNGGEIMPVEASVARGSGTLSLTGQLGSVMQESAQAALFYARANAELLGLDPHFFSKHDFHIHVPSGATPKDGPSAGITIACALVSALSGRPVSPHHAMTGEMTLRGHILAVGGLKEKALAALRFGIRNVIIPADNLKDIEDIPKEQRDNINFLPVREVSEVLALTLLKKPRTSKSPQKQQKTGSNSGSVPRRNLKKSSLEGRNQRL
jgi:ATP-dependent Lon protease